MSSLHNLHTERACREWSEWKWKRAERKFIPGTIPILIAQRQDNHNMKVAEITCLYDWVVLLYSVLEIRHVPCGHEEITKSFFNPTYFSQNITIPSEVPSLLKLHFKHTAFCTHLNRSFCSSASSPVARYIWCNPVHYIFHQQTKSKDLKFLKHKSKAVVGQYGQHLLGNFGLSN